MEAVTVSSLQGSCRGWLIGKIALKWDLSGPAPNIRFGFQRIIDLCDKSCSFSIIRLYENDWSICECWAVQDWLISTIFSFYNNILSSLRYPLEFYIVYKFALCSLETRSNNPSNEKTGKFLINESKSILDEFGFMKKFAIDNGYRFDKINII